MKKSLVCAVMSVALMLLFTMPGTAETADKAAPAPGKPEIIYITDFEIDVGDVSQQTGILQRPKRVREDPASKAARLVELLSISLVSDLQNKSIPAKRLYRGQSLPDRGWLVTGEFLEVDEGNSLRRAAVGFGAGATDMLVQVAVIDLSKGSKDPFVTFGTDSRSGRGPGAVVFPNPYVAAAKFVLSKRASESDIRKTARQIANVLAKYIEEGGA